MKELEEFKREVSMLDKFRCNYIIHFYGASFVTSKICMITEYAKHGSLQDLISKKKKIKHIMRIKILIYYLV